jgi:hypothetical protein
MNVQDLFFKSYHAKILKRHTYMEADMVNTAEKILDADPHAAPQQKTIEQWLRTDVVKACEEIMANPSDSMPIDEFFDSLLEELG